MTIWKVGGGHKTANKSWKAEMSLKHRAGGRRGAGGGEKHRLKGRSLNSFCSRGGARQSDGGRKDLRNGG